MLSIFNYIEPASFLNDVFEEKRKTNPLFSLRSWAKQLGMKSHGPLHAMLNGQRAIPKKYIPKLLSSLKLNAKEIKYFEALIDFSRAKNMEEKEFYHQRLQSLSPKELREVEDLVAYKYHVDPLHHIIGEMTELKDFKDSLPWIKSHMRINPNMLEIEEALNRLLSLGVLKRDNGKLQKQIQHIYTKNDIMDKAIQQYHMRMGQIAIDQIEKQPVEEREFSGVTFNIHKKDLPKIKEALREFSDQLIQSFEAKSKEGEETYHLNLHFFSLTKK